MCELKYVIKDAEGLDVTENLPEGYEVKFVSAAGTTKVSEAGEVEIDAGTTVKVKATVVDKDDKVVAESKEISVTADAAKASKIANFTVADAAKVGTDVDNLFAADDFETNQDITSGVTNQQIYLQLGDQLDEALEAKTGEALPEGYTAEFVSQSPLVALVDKTTGKITPVSKGTAEVKVTVKDAEGKTVTTKTITINVKAVAAPATITADKEAVTVTNSEFDDNSQTVKLSVKDQYDNAIDGSIPTDAVSYKVFNDKDEDITDSTKLKVTLASAGTTGDYTAKVEGFNNEAVAKGEYTVKVFADAQSKVSTSFKVNVVEAGETASYTVTGDILDNDTVDLVDGDALALTVSPSDKDGYITGTALTADADTTIKVDNEKVVVNDTTDTLDLSALKAGDTFKVTVTVKINGEGVPVVVTKDIKVVDTTPVYTAKFTTTSLKGATTDTLTALLQAKVLVNKDSEKASDQTITAINFVSADTSVVKANATGTLAAGTATVIVKSITTAESGEITFEEPVVFTVTVK